MSMRWTVLMLVAAPLLVVSTAGGGCPVGNPGFDGGLSDRQSGYDAAGNSEALYSWAISTTFTDGPKGGAPVAFAAGTGGRLAVGYYVDPEPPVEHVCTHNYGQATIYDAEVKVARYDGSTWATDTISNVHSAQAMAASYCGDTLYLAYMAGETTGTICGASQLAVRTITDGSIGNETILTPDSSTGDACRLMQNACNLGDTIGRFPSMTCLPDGRLLLAYQDPHYGFGQQTDIEGSDLEVVLGNPPLSGGDRRCIDDSSGAGQHNSAFAGAGGRAAVATWVSQTHDFNSTGCLDNPPPETSYSWGKGIYVDQEQEGGDWTNTRVADEVIGQRLAAAYSEADGYVVAYSFGSSLAAYVSPDGVSWQRQIIDGVGRNGISPSAAVDGQGRILVAYGRCSNSAAAACRSSDDGVWLAALVDGSWQTEKVVNDVDSTDGVEVMLAIDPDTGYPVIAYRNATSNRIMLAQGTPR